MNRVVALARNPWARGLFVLASLVLAILAVWWRGPDWNTVYHAFDFVRWRWVIVAVLLNLLSVLARAWAWNVTIRQAMPEPLPPFRQVFSAFGVGLLANDAYARIQNNRIEGVTTSGACSATVSDAVRLQLGTGLNEVDLHSNDLVGQLGGGACTSRGLAFALLGDPPAGPRGMIRNNIVSAGACDVNIAVDETNAGSDPRLLQNNDLWSPVAPTALYRDEAASNLATIAAVNALADTTASGNISANPLYDGSNKLQAASPCREAGLLTGAPPFDFEGDARPQGPLCDIGRDEFVP